MRFATPTPTPFNEADGLQSSVRPKRRDRWKDENPDVLEALAQEITTLSARIREAEYRLLMLIRDFDKREGWKRLGFACCADWLAYSTGRKKVTAREWVRVAHALGELPEISQAMSRGDLSFSQVRALVRVADADTETELLEHAQSMTADRLEKFLRGWSIGTHRDDLEIDRARHAARRLSIFPAIDGTYDVAGRLEPEIAALVMRAIDAASDALYQGSVPEVKPEQRRADALELIAERVLAVGFGEMGVDPRVARKAANEPSDSTVAEPRDSAESATTASASRDSGEAIASNPAPISGSRAERYQVMLDVELPDLMVEDVSTATGSRGPVCESLRTGGIVASEVRPNGESVSAGNPRPHRANLEDGTRLSRETLRRMTCDASIARVARAPDGKVLDVGRKTRVVSPALRRALESRDRGCRFPGCGSRFTDAHHIRHWADGGETSVENLILLCRTHHRLLHEGAFSLRRDSAESGQPVFVSPRGVRIPERPPRMRIAGRVIAARDESDAQSLEWERDVPLEFYLRLMQRLGR